ncbi:class I SAM-dependent methyltransferase [Streptomyces armeniacus]|uniref:Class I SAM-dependent methyltransferase n=1 Tax=Streptomyces armeniacus TaxID=83291 RepID=A0A345XMF4_9ACTN|nr:class I SAM-dependent methyltransferase [Streptomyces armeniacus]AXK32820.1 class I SAM-dependent methyltransferase [Streptomyces armeniacus]
MTAQHSHGTQHKHQHEDQHQHHQHGHGAHNHHNIDWEAMAAHLEAEAELLSPFIESAADWLRRAITEAEAGANGDGADGAHGVRRVLDVGSGPGVVTCVLARTFPYAETVAVDQGSGLLERVAARAAEQGLGDRVRTRQADLPAEFGALGSADVIWTSHVVHHLGDQQAALESLAGVLRPGGLLAVVERGLPARFLPRDIGIGRPGLQARLDAVVEDRFSEMRAELPGSVGVVEDWPGMLAAAGLVPAGTRTFLTDHPAPLALSAREYLHTHLTRLRDGVGEQLDAEDRETLDRLVDGDACTGILWRPDAFYATATTVHTARAPHPG